MEQQPQQRSQQEQQQQNPSPKAEDDDGGGTTSIDTFQEYKPTALPSKVVRACNGWYGRNSISTGKENEITIEEGDSRIVNSIHNGGIDKSKGGALDDVIDLTEEETETKPETSQPNDSTGEKPKEQQQEVVISNPPASAQLAVPSHTSSACESALLSSVAAPIVPDETAECLLPLLSSQSSKSERTVPPPLSPLQLEGVLLSIQRHRRVHFQGNPNANATGVAFRAGFFLGDGAGIGSKFLIEQTIDLCCHMLPFS